MAEATGAAADEEATTATEDGVTTDEAAAVEGAATEVGTTVVGAADEVGAGIETSTELLIVVGAASVETAALKSWLWWKCSFTGRDTAAADVAAAATVVDSAADVAATDTVVDSAAGVKTSPAVT